MGRKGNSSPLVIQKSFHSPNNRVKITEERGDHRLCLKKKLIATSSIQITKKIRAHL